MELYDLVTGTAQWVMVAALIFSLGPRRSVVITGAMTAACLAIVSAASVLAGYWNIAAATGTASILWALITRHHMKKPRKKKERRKERPLT